MGRSGKDTSLGAPSTTTDRNPSRASETVLLERSRIGVQPGLDHRDRDRQAGLVVAVVHGANLSARTPAQQGLRGGQDPDRLAARARPLGG